MRAKKEIMVSRIKDNRIESYQNKHFPLELSRYLFPAALVEFNLLFESANNDFFKKIIKKKTGVLPATSHHMWVLGCMLSHCSPCLNFIYITVPCSPFFFKKINKLQFVKDSHNQSG